MVFQFVPDSVLHILGIPEHEYRSSLICLYLPPFISQTELLVLQYLLRLAFLNSLVINLDSMPIYVNDIRFFFFPFRVWLLSYLPLVFFSQFTSSQTSAFNWLFYKMVLMLYCKFFVLSFQVVKVSNGIQFLSTGWHKL